MLNCAIIMGRLTADPELRTTGSGLSVTSFCVAVDRSYVIGFFLFALLSFPSSFFSFL